MTTAFIRSSVYSFFLARSRRLRQGPNDYLELLEVLTGPLFGFHIQGKPSPGVSSRQATDYRVLDMKHHRVFQQFSTCVINPY